MPISGCRWRRNATGTIGDVRLLGFRTARKSTVDLRAVIRGGFAVVDPSVRRLGRPVAGRLIAGWVQRMGLGKGILRPKGRRKGLLAGEF